MAKRKFYAVHKGNKVGVFNTWDECKKQVDGFKGPVYKSFPTKEEAQHFSKTGKELKGSSNKQVSNKHVPELRFEDYKANPGDIQMYVDGSFMGNKGGYGLVVVRDNKVIKEFCGPVELTDGLASKNVPGELMATTLATTIAKQLKLPKIYVIYDYMGIEKWARDEWKRNLPLTKQYFEFMQDAFSKGVDITFIKVKAHKGHKFNEIADDLAKRGTRGEKLG
ncbi:ribonuclease H family protein [Paraclostridium bifermentans]